MKRSGTRPRTGARCADALGALVQTLRGISVARGDHPWLLLDLTMVQLKALMLLVQHGAMRSSDLAGALSIKPSAATPLVDRLESQKVAKRRPDPDDRRIIWIEPTPHGTALYEKLMRMNRSVLEDVAEAVPPDRREQVYESVVLLLEGAGQVRARKRKTPASTEAAGKPEPGRTRASRNRR